MTYRVRFLARARKEFLELPKHVRDRFEPRIDALGDDPRPHGADPLRGALKGLWRLRVGDYRVSYHIDDDARLVTVVQVGHRRDIYRRLTRRR